MELHVPHGSIRSVKDFLVHIGIVTVGVVIALGLSQLVEAHHRSKMAAETLEGFHREITFAQSQVKQVLVIISTSRGQMETEIAKLSVPPTQGAVQEPIEYPTVFYQLIRKASWETAIATQVLGALPPDKVRGYELAYEELQLFVDLERTGVGYHDNLHAYGENAASLSAEERRALIKELRRYQAFSRFLELAGEDTLKMCAIALN
jgi:hypothetical protein